MRVFTLFLLIFIVNISADDCGVSVVDTLYDQENVTFLKSLKHSGGQYRSELYAVIDEMEQEACGLGGNILLITDIRAPRFDGNPYTIKGDILYSDSPPAEGVLSDERLNELSFDDDYKIGLRVFGAILATVSCVITIITFTSLLKGPSY